MRSYLLDLSPPTSPSPALLVGAGADAWTEHYLQTTVLHGSGSVSSIIIATMAGIEKFYHTIVAYILFLYIL